MQLADYYLDNKDRYHFDFGECSYENGFCQIDTTQDASYYGNWIHLDKMYLVSYAEGDVRRIQFDNRDEVVKWLRNVYGLIHIDPGLGDMRERTIKRMQELGITELLPKSEREQLKKETS